MGGGRAPVGRRDIWVGERVAMEVGDWLHMGELIREKENRRLISYFLRRELKIQKG